MRLYVETNFVLELVYDQEQHSAADELMRLVDGGRASLHVPVFAIAEAMSTAPRRAKARWEVQKSVQGERKLLERSAGRGAVIASLNAAAEQLAGVNEDDRDRLDAVIARLLAVATALPLDIEVDARAGGYRSRFDLTSPDAMVLASIVTDLSRQSPP